MAETVKKKLLQGTVVSDKMDKGIVVRVDYKKKHPIFKKYMVRSKKIMVHDEQNSAHNGDFVSVQPCRPISKNKKFMLTEIVKKAGAGV